MGHFMRFWARSHNCGGPHIHKQHGEETMGFGVRRPLRFLAWKLDLERDQVEKLAKILDSLKTERAQAAVDERRTVSAFADAIASEVFGEESAKSAQTLRAESGSRVAEAVAKALREIHGILNQEQRQKLAYLIRAGHLGL